MVTPLDRQLMRHVTGPAPVGADPFPSRQPASPPRHDSGIGRRALAVVSRILRAIAVAQERRATARALQVLDDHALHDIGIARGSIPEVARQAASAHLAVAGLSWTTAAFDTASNDNPRHRVA